MHSIALATEPCHTARIPRSHKSGTHIAAAAPLPLRQRQMEKGPRQATCTRERETAQHSMLYDTPYQNRPVSRQFNPRDDVYHPSYMRTRSLNMLYVTEQFPTQTGGPAVKEIAERHWGRCLHKARTCWQQGCVRQRSDLVSRR